MGSEFMKKKHNIIMLVAFVVAVLPLVMPAFMAFSEPVAVTVTVDGQIVPFQGQEAVIIENRTFVPVRGVFEMMGFEVEWNTDSRLARLTNEDHTIIIPADVSAFVVNGEIIIPDVPQRLINNRMMLPLRAVAEAIGGTAHWDANTRVAIIESQSSNSENNEGGYHTPFPTLSPSLTPWPTIPIPTPWPTPCPYATPSPPQSPPPYPPRTINDYLRWDRSTRHSVFNVEFFRVADEEIISEWGQAYGTIESAFNIWAEHNNIQGVTIINSGFFRDFAGGWNRTIALNLSPEFKYYVESENGLLLTESLAYTLMGMWRPVFGSVRFTLIVCDVDSVIFVNRPEDALFFRDTRFYEYDYPHFYP